MAQMNLCFELPNGWKMSSSSVTIGTIPYGPPDGICSLAVMGVIVQLC